MVVMKQALAFTTRAVFSGLLILIPLYLAVLLLLKGMKTVAGLVRPFALLLPDWIPAETALSLVLVLVICFIMGAAVLTRAGQAARDRIERTFLRENSGLRAAPRPHPADGGEEPREYLEAGAAR